MATAKEGYLLKNHAGSDFGTGSKKRYFASDGFHVTYYSAPNKKSLKGHFDLRNVESLAPSRTKAAGDGAIDLVIGEAKGKSKKVMTISFKEASGERAAWLTLWTSAVLGKNVNTSLRSFIDVHLVNVLNEQFGSQSALANRRTSFLGLLNVTEREVSASNLLTPRTNLEPLPEDAPSTAGAPSSTPMFDSSPRGVDQSPVSEAPGLDTPRETPPGTPLEAMAPPPPKQSLGQTPPVQPPSTASDTGAGAASSEETFEITIPEGVAPGSRLQATTPSGVRVKLVVPEGARPGMLLTFEVPAGARSKSRKRREEDAAQHKQATVIQAAIRGRQARKGDGPLAPPMPPPGAKGLPTGVPPTRVQIESAAHKLALERAAVKVQSVHRGHQARNEQQEASRLQWFEYYLQSDVSEFDQAEALAVSNEEISRVKAARAASGEVDADELRRIQWLQHYIKVKDFAKATEMVATAVEGATVLKATAMASRVFCACIPKADQVEAERLSKFASSLRTHDFEVAEVLAISGDEFEEVATQQKRYESMMKAQLEGNFDKAFHLAKYNEEVTAILDAKKGVQEGLATGDEATDAAAVKLQASFRGRAAREKVETDKVDRAAVKVQSLIRGHISRDAQQEARRQEWLKYYAGEKQYEKALALAVSQREIDAVNALRLESVTKLELEETCWCFTGGFNKPDLETGQNGGSNGSGAAKPKERPFVTAIREYNWGAAEALADDDEDLRDLAESKARVEWLRTYTRQHKFNEALELAITAVEVNEITGEHAKQMMLERQQWAEERSKGQVTMKDFGF